ncbi:ADP-ribosylation factor 3 isoform X2 [Canis lupus dingo]|uniref:ADP-ribosylation factor 3 isoform X2 n=1 Tax=Canis lupus dingo TaxID=286419 RepID=UPI0015F13080|nr:ADP-ribosylation factor 3 isoform X2 [Canis lupus dingo]
MVTALSRELPLATTQLSRDRGGGKYPGLGVGVRRTAPVAVAASGARWREGRREPGSAARGAAVPESAGGSRRERNQRRAEPAGAEAAAAAAELGAGTGLENAAFSSPPSCSTLVLEDQSLAAVTPCTPFVGQKKYQDSRNRKWSHCFTPVVEGRRGRWSSLIKPGRLNSKVVAPVFWGSSLLSGLHYCLSPSGQARRSVVCGQE